MSLTRSAMIDGRTYLYAALAVSITILLRHRRQEATRRKIVHPPSPTSLPIVGNVLSMPPGLEHLAFMKLGQELNSRYLFL